jgi:threonine dehydrogenase-like Zn-dependent dehydrogenase
MKAVVMHEYGGPDVLKYEDVPDPVPGKGEVLIRIAAASINPVDLWQRAGATKASLRVEFPARSIGADQVVALDDQAAVDALPPVDIVANTVHGGTAEQLQGAKSCCSLERRRSSILLNEPFF